ncbi:hypothetical protein Cme02nite_26650 [Catellatospora methionotrophica]|uniref:Uncharacterized protein n=1 Tax=Catellatospora methionotrophica TaxID=121620 RepID=A0A8J3L4Q0_9ACTN|nr:hypothetical protein Cme02nite_26650 [Catellatospora methionotrophica]
MPETGAGAPDTGEAGLFSAIGSVAGVGWAGVGSASGGSGTAGCGVVGGVTVAEANGSDGGGYAGCVGCGVVGCCSSCGWVMRISPGHSFRGRDTQLPPRRLSLTAPRTPTQQGSTGEILMAR